MHKQSILTDSKNKYWTAHLIHSELPVGNIPKYTHGRSQHKQTNKINGTEYKLGILFPKFTLYNCDVIVLKHTEGQPMLVLDIDF